MFTRNAPIVGQKPPEIKALRCPRPSCATRSGAIDHIQELNDIADQAVKRGKARFARLAGALIAIHAQGDYR